MNDEANPLTNEIIIKDLKAMLLEETLRKVQFGIKLLEGILETRDLSEKEKAELELFTNLTKYSK